MIRVVCNVGFALVLSVVVGCANGPSTWRLVSAEVGTRVTKGKTIVDDKPDAGRVVLHIRTTCPDYFALLLPANATGMPEESSPNAQLGSGVQLGYPFLRVEDGYAYVVGDKPAAQTEHVVAGSESTIIAMQVDHNGNNADRSKWIHRVHVLQAANPVYVWAQNGWDGPRPTKPAEVAEGFFVESTFDAASNCWVLSQAKSSAGSTGSAAFIAAVKGAADKAGLELP